MRQSANLRFFLFLFLIFPTLCFAEGYRTMDEGIMVDENGNRIKGKIEYVQRQSDLALIPCVAENADYATYLSDVKNGADVKPYDYDAEAQRQKDAEENLKNEKEKEALIQTKIKEMSEAELRKEGKLDENGTVVEQEKTP